MHTPVATLLTDLSGNITKLNIAARKLLILNPEIPEGKPWHQYIEDLPDIRYAWQQALETKEAFNIEFQHSYKGGEHLEGGAKWLTICIQPLPDQDHVLVVLIDITASKLVERQARGIVDNAVESIISIDERGTIESINPAAVKLFEFKNTAQAIGLNIKELMPSTDRKNHNKYINNYIQTGQRKIIGIGRQLIAVTQSGTRVPIYLAISEVNVDGTRRFTGIIRDLSDQQAAEREIGQLRERMTHVSRLSTMGEMTAGIAHEINQPLTAISLYAKSAQRLLKPIESDNPKLTEILNKLDKQAIRAGAIIERIQRFSRYQETDREEANLKQLVAEVISLAEPDARRYGVILKVKGNADEVNIHCDPIQIQQVILNFLRNAIDAMVEINFKYGKKVTIEIKTDNDQVCLYVSDLGNGVSGANTDRMFTPFHTTKSEGMGMGLSISKSIIDSHKGTIGFTNRTDTGATFYFSLPVSVLTGEGA